MRRKSAFSQSKTSALLYGPNALSRKVLQINESKLAGVKTSLEELAIIEEFDGERTVCQVSLLIDISDEKLFAYVCNWLQSGLLLPVRKDKLKPADKLKRVPSGEVFSPLEESFFDSEVAPIDMTEEPLENWEKRVQRFALRVVNRDEPRWIHARPIEGLDSAG